MSKSLGNVISPFELIPTFESDAVRYYMIKDGGVEGDGRFDRLSLMNRKTSLTRQMGNLVNRITAGRWNLNYAVVEVSSREGGWSAGIEDQDSAIFFKQTSAAISKYEKDMERLDLKGALEEVDTFWRLVHLS